MTTSRAAKSTCHGKCVECKRSTMNGGTCPTWERVEWLLANNIAAAPYLDDEGELQIAYSNEPLSRGQVARELRITKRQVDQIVAGAIAKMRAAVERKRVGERFAVTVPKAA